MLHQNHSKLGFGSVLHDSNNSISNKEIHRIILPLISCFVPEYARRTIWTFFTRRRGIKSKLELKSYTDYVLRCYTNFNRINGSSETLPYNLFKEVF